MRKWIIWGLAIAGILLAGLAAAFLHLFNAPVVGALYGRAKVEDSVLHARLQVPDGFTWTIFASGITNARMMAFTAAGDLLLSSPRQGKVFLLTADQNGDGAADEVRTVLQGLNYPHGLTTTPEYLFVAESDRLLRYPFNHQSGEVTGEPAPLLDLPGGLGHRTRTVRLGPDGYLYVSAGSSCNVCEEKDEKRAALMRIKPDGSDYSLYATGLRNAVGFDWAPWDDALYATENGSDLQGDDFPPCELNHIVAGGFYGWPYRSGKNVPDPDYGDKNPQLAATAIASAHDFRAHNAPLGMSFIPVSSALPAYERAALVALHGSWNRKARDGYKVVSLHWDEAGRITEQDFMTGFLDGEKVFGRPVDVAAGPDGAFYVSDDYTGNIYRVAPVRKTP